MNTYRIDSTDKEIIASEEYMELMHPNDYTDITPAAPTHKTLITSKELMSLFEGDELDRLYDCVNASVQKLVFRLTNREVSIDTTGSLYAASIALLRSEGIIDSDVRRDELLLGFPINFKRIT